MMVVENNGMLPPLALYPPDNVRSHLPPDEWQACLDAWILNVQLRLRPTSPKFAELSASDAGVPFILTYLASNRHNPLPTSRTKEAVLRQNSYLLLKRILLQSTSDLDSSDLYQLLSCGSIVFATINDWTSTLMATWKSKTTQIKKIIEFEKTMSTSQHLSTERLQRLSALTRCLPDIAVITMAGADYLDTLMSTYSSAPPELQRAITEITYYSFMGLIATKHIPLLLDNLYHMKSEAGRSRKDQASLLSSLVCTTTFLRHLRSNSEMARRQQSMVEYLSSYRSDMVHIHPPRERGHRRRLKGKGKGHPNEEMHVHQATQISQVHELFPELSTAYVLRLLDHFSDDVESVIATLLEPTSLPPQLQDQQATATDSVGLATSSEDLAPRSTPPLPPTRRNVFENDDFDRLQISSNAIRRGKKDPTANAVQDIAEHSRSKAAIMSALAAFDADDDERDDTYDVADVGGAVDNTVDTDARTHSHEKHEAVLYKAWKENPELFARDSKTRMSKIRQQLKQETEMTDEQIEGWAVMLKRDPKLENRLQTKQSAERQFQGKQKALESTKWNANASTENSEAESGAEASGSDTRRMGQAGIRGHRSFGRGRGRGGSTSGPAESADTQAARRRKEQGRGRGGASHNRREGRAKKMGRGMAALQS